MEQLTDTERCYLIALIDFELESLAIQIRKAEQRGISQPYYLTDLAIATAIKAKLIKNETN
jgi:hypothetical protein